MTSSSSSFFPQQLPEVPIVSPIPQVQQVQQKAPEIQAQQPQDVDNSFGLTVLSDLAKKCDEGLLPASRDIPLSSLYFDANKMWENARLFRTKGDAESAYLYFLKYTTYVLQRIPFHPTYSLPMYDDDKQAAKNKAGIALKQLEILKGEILRSYQTSASDMPFPSVPKDDKN
eukprot:TRINITY_DN4142_c0_g1_i2.p1 TRINITY_DN4142_c0_g1~~TRINITY_DN4142_c0_g1_i2.p1  ORF type:complete len:172 (+),score=52.12 TRINITY_DN4142_c0_g1_i2:563-1078(+)